MPNNSDDILPFSYYIFLLYSPTLKGQCHENFVLTETVGFRLGRTDVPQPLLTSVYCPFNLLRSVEDDVRRSKTDFCFTSMDVAVGSCSLNLV